MSAARSIHTKAGFAARRVFGFISEGIRKMETKENKITKHNLNQSKFDIIIMAVVAVVIVCLVISGISYFVDNLGVYFQ
jgi:hypothetical protein